MLSNAIDPPKHTLPTTPSSSALREKRERLMKIEQKLEAITVHRQNQARESSEEELTRRVL